MEAARPMYFSGPRAASPNTASYSQLQLQTTYDNLWQLMTTYDNLWQLMTTYDTYDNLWKLMKTFDIGAL